MRRTYKSGDKVFAKIRGYPHWPAIVDGVADESSGKLKYLVTFYATEEKGVIKEADILPFVENEGRLGKPRKTAFFNEALKLIKEELTEQELQELTRSQTNSVNESISVESKSNPEDDLSKSLLAPVHQDKEIDHGNVVASICPKFSPGEKVFGKVKGYPPWPGLVEALEDSTPGDKKYLVYFFGSGETSVVQEENISLYIENKDRFGKPRKNKLFNKALDQIEEHLREKELGTSLEPRSNSSAGENKPHIHPENRGKKRKSGDSVSINHKSFSPGEKVFAKVHGYPPWPACIEEIVDHTPNNRRYHVHFYGSGDTAIVKEKDVFPYEENKDRFGKPKKIKYFNEALEEINEELAEQTLKKPESPKNVVNYSIVVESKSIKEIKSQKNAVNEGISVESKNNPEDDLSKSLLAPMHQDKEKGCDSVVASIYPKFSPGEKVFGKVKGYPPWPGLVEALEDSTPGKMKYLIYFFGSGETSVVQEENVFLYIENKDRFGKPRKNKIFNKALDQIEEHLREKELGTSIESKSNSSDGENKPDIYPKNRGKKRKSDSSVSINHKSFSPGEKVFAKVHGFPHWPANIKEIADNTPNNRSYVIHFYGSGDAAIVKEKDIFPYEENKDRFGKPKKIKYFNEALEEINEQLSEETIKNPESPKNVVNENTLVESKSNKKLKIQKNSMNESISVESKLSPEDDVIKPLLTTEQLTKDKEFDDVVPNVCAKFSAGDSVFGKVKSYPPWPGRVEAIKDSTPSEIKYSVYFFGSGETSVLDEGDLVPYLDFKVLFGKPRKNKLFNKALNLIEEYQREKELSTVVESKSNSSDVENKPLKAEHKGKKKDSLLINNGPFFHGDKVFAKVLGHPHWPALVEKLVDDSPNIRKYRIYFYGTGETAIVKEKDIFPYFQYKDRFGQPRKTKYFNEALEQINEELRVQELKKIKSLNEGISLESKSTADNIEHSVPTKNVIDKTSSIESSESETGLQSREISSSSVYKLNQNGRKSTNTIKSQGPQDLPDKQSTQYKEFISAEYNGTKYILPLNLDNLSFESKSDEELWNKTIFNRVEKIKKMLV